MYTTETKRQVATHQTNDTTKRWHVAIEYTNNTKHIIHSRHVANRCSHECTRQRQSGKPLHKQERNAEVAFVFESRSTLRVLGEMPDASNGPAASPHGLSGKKKSRMLFCFISFRFRSPRTITAGAGTPVPVPLSNWSGPSAAMMRKDNKGSRLMPSHRQNANG
jgi:hypothetical protein